MKQLRRKLAFGALAVSLLATTAVEAHERCRSYFDLPMTKFLQGLDHTQREAATKDAASWVKTLERMAADGGPIARCSLARMHFFGQTDKDGMIGLLQLSELLV